ncbi:hypothetical protein HK100_010459 [Physocladia obscura]|uniref:Lebercilin domain-containing protein n=1 Tax=Physocladia obscura TaxID=109957 RepID=A0AAD5T597_9FUNG|nr:hypothetical protein HK100_010459 [Physocladia obscura]
MAQPFQFYEGALTQAAFIVSASENSNKVVNKSANSASTLLSESCETCQLEPLETTNRENSDNEYDFDFEHPEDLIYTESRLSPLPPQPMPTLNESKQKPLVLHKPKALPKYEGRTHPLLVPANIHPTSGVFYHKLSAKKKQLRKTATSGTVKRFGKIQSKEPIVQQRKMESILYETRPKNKDTQAVVKTDFEQIAKLSLAVDTLKSKLRDRDEEIKTLKIVNRRQEMCLNSRDKSQTELPRQYHTQLEDFRALRQTHALCAVKISNAEKSSQEHIEETVQLREKIAKLAMIIKTRCCGNSVEKMQIVINRLKTDVCEKDGNISDLEKKLKILESGNTIVIRDLRSKNGKLAKELEEIKTKVKEITEKLEEKDRQIAAISIQSLLHPDGNAIIMFPQNVANAPHQFRQHPTSKLNLTQTTLSSTTAKATTRINLQQSVHKPTLQKHQKSTSPPMKPNNDKKIRTWNLAGFDVSGEGGSMSDTIDLQKIHEMLHMVEQSEETPVAIVARRFLLMQKAAVERLISPEEEPQMPPVAAKQNARTDITKSDSE